MDEAARQVFVKNKQFIKKNLHLDNCLLDYLEAEETLTSDNVESVQAEKTNENKISRLLMILQRKGPTAFDKFLEALTTTKSTYLADELRKKYDEEKENLKECYTESTTIADNSINSADETLEDAGEETAPKETMETDTLNIRNPQYADTCRRMSLQSTHSQACLNNMHHKLKMHLFHMNERELSFGQSPIPVTIEMVDELVDRLLKIEQDCYKVLRVVNRKSLLSHVIDLKEGRKQLQKTIDNKEEQTKKYAGRIFKLDHRCKDLERTLKALEDRHKECTEEKQQLQETAEHIKQGMTAEHKTLESHMKYVIAENAQLKSRINEYKIEQSRMSEKIKQLEETKVSNEAITSTKQRQQNQDTHSELSDVLSSKMHEETNRKPSTLQDCKDICTAPDPNRLTKLRAKVLFAESMKNDGHHQNRKTNMEQSVNNSRGYHKHSRVERQSETNIQADSTENRNSMKENFKTNSSIEAVVKLTEKYNKRLKSPLKKQSRRPTWSRKPLK